jgi:putative tryptophan/tyrosine transport system substrate-binding protein
VTTGTTSALGAKSGAADVPIVFLTQVDPVPVGLVASLSHPGGNATGLYLVTADLLTKRMDLARQVAPDRSPIVLIVNPKGAEAEAQLYEADKVASDTGLQIQTRKASTPNEINIAFTALTRPNVGAITIGSDPLFFSQRDQIVALAMREAIPVIYDRREYVTTGGLMSYGPNLADAFGRLGLYAGKVLKGARPAELPVEQAARFEFVLNLKTARTLGLSLKLTLLALADEVIE